MDHVVGRTHLLLVMNSIISVTKLQPILLNRKPKFSGVKGVVMILL